MQFLAHDSLSVHPAARSHGTPVVFVVHGDESMREFIEALLRRGDWQVRSFADAGSFLSHARAPGPACAVLDLDLPDIGGLDLQALVADRPELPVIVTANDASVRTTVHAMKAGAVEFLTRPIDEGLLLDATRQALQQSCAALAREAEARVLHDRFCSLSPREREVMQLVVAGRLNKHVAEALGISEITVKAHRGKVMRKMRAASLPHLVNMAAVLRVGRCRLGSEREHITKGMPQNVSTSTIAFANACGASCGRLWPMPPAIRRCSYLPENFFA
jgi:FixJ family two-component response regulator